MKKNKQKSNDKQLESLHSEGGFSFRDAVADVRPLKTEARIHPVKKRPSPRPRSREENNDSLNAEQMSDPIHLNDVEISDELFFARAGIQHKLQKKLRKGEIPVEDELDLHGYTATEAKVAINEFFALCKRHRLRCVRLIHGKGYRSESKIPVLKTYVAYWLPQHKDVMAFSSARPYDGGTGALYVLLKLER